MTSRYTALLAALLLLPASPARSASDTLAAYIDIAEQSGPAVNADGSHVAFWGDARNTAQIFWMMAGGSFPIQLTFGSQPDYISASPKDPNLLLVAGDRDGSEIATLYLIRTDTGATQNLLDDGPRVRHPYAVFSPDGQYVAFSSNKRVANTFDVWRVRLADRREDLVFQAEPGTIARPEAFSSDDRRLLVTRLTSNFNSDLYEADLQSGRSTMLTAHQGDAFYKTARYGKDGHTIYVITDKGRQYRGIARIDERGTTFLTPDTFDVDEFALRPHANDVLFVRNDGGFGRLAFLRHASGYTDVAMPPGVASDISVDPLGRYAAFSFQGPTHPGEVWKLDFASWRASELTHATLNGLERRSFVDPQLVTYKSFDGRDIPAFYWRATTCGGKCPVTIDIHGGPEDQTRAWFDPQVQYLVSHGMSVLQPNVRGSTGYGRTYLHLADVRRREDSVADLNAAHAWLTSYGNADPHRVVLMGASYGGYMTLAGLIDYPDDWAAGVDIYGPTNFVTFLENTAPYRRANREAVYGSLEHDRDFLESISPINHVDKIRAPVMIFAGQNDPRVPVEQSQSFADALKARNIPVTLTIFSNEGHGVSHKDNLLRLYGDVDTFYNAYLGTSL